jgi:tetratricopeptide (TPR) repeat protein
VKPAIIAFDDFQWADASTVEFAKLLVEQGARVPLMQIYTERSGFVSPWPAQPHQTQLTLDRLSDREARDMVERVASDKGLSPETVATVVQRATGVPLFVEELTRDSIERGGYSTPTEIPATLQDSLMARLDRIGPARELAQIGAVIGGEFSHKLLHLVSNVNERELRLALDDLVIADLLHVSRSEPENSYIFKHALLQDAAYNTLLKTRRRELHQRIAQILEERYPETATSAPELLAHHHTEAGSIEQAVRYWRRAGRRAIERSANLEAIAQLHQGLELLTRLPQSSERLMSELRLQMALTTPLAATKGYADPEVEKACKRALELCQQLGEAPQLFTVLGGLNSIYFNRGELEIALELARQMLRLAETQQDPVLLLWAHYALGFAFASQGRLTSARDHLERSISLYDVRKGGSYGFVQDPGPTAIALLSHAVHRLGYPEQALGKMREAVVQARNLSHLFTLARVLGSAAALHWERGEKSAARVLWEEEAALCSKQGFKELLGSVSLRIGFAQVEEGSAEAGLRKMHDALTSLANSLVIDKLHDLGFLALAEGKAGLFDQGLARIDEALRLAKERPTYWVTFLLNLIKGRLLLMQRPSALRKARQSFSIAIEIARDQSAKSDELTVAIQLARVLVQQGHRDQARSMLKKIYNWFTEGFDTADLKEAKALLEELSS